MPASVFIPSGAGAPGFGGILELLLQAGHRVCAGDRDPNAYGRGLVRDFSVMPSSDAPDYVEVLIATANKFHCEFILPITTGELLPLAQNLHHMELAGLKLAISPASGLEIANDKRLLYDFCAKQNIPHPEYRRVHSREELLSAARALGFPQKQVFLKPASGNGSRGIKLLCSPKQAQEAWAGAKAGGILCTEAALMAEMPEKLSFEYLACEYLPGREYSVDLICDRGQTLLCLPRLRDKTVSGISVSGTFVQNGEIGSMCDKLVSSLGLHGPIGIQFKENEAGQPLVLEINPRLQGAVSTCIYMGYNIPALAIEIASGNSPRIPGPNWDRPARFGRYWKDVSL